MASIGDSSKNEFYQKICTILQEFVNETGYSDVYSKTESDSIVGLESEIMSSDSALTPKELIHITLDILRNEFSLDYDDLVFEGNWVPQLPKMIVRNCLLRHFLELGNGLDCGGQKFSDATLNNAADDYTGFIDLLVIKIQTLGEITHYRFGNEEIVTVEDYLIAILMLMKHCRDMLDMSSTLRPSLFQMRNRRMEGRIRSVIEMSTMRMECPRLKELLSEVSASVIEISNDKGLRDLQIARNERYKQSKIRLYNYTIRCTEDLNNQLEACDPYDFTHRNDLKKQLEQVMIFQRSFEKDR